MCTERATKNKVTAQPVLDDHYGKSMERIKAMIKVWEVIARWTSLVSVGGLDAEPEQRSSLCCRSSTGLHQGIPVPQCKGPYRQKA